MITNEKRHAIRDVKERYHPGLILKRDYFDKEESISQRQLARELGFHESIISDLFNCAKNMTPAVAVALEARYDKSAMWWLTRQAIYELMLYEVRQAHE